jgi:flagellar motility protein MotE (MotC chaperone)
MMRATPGTGPGARASLWASIALALGASLFCVVVALPASAQQGWEPVVATANPDTLGRALDSGSAAPVRRQAPMASPAIEAFIAPARMAERQQKPAAADAGPVPPRASAQPPALRTAAARQYCTNIADAAADARVAWQKKSLADIEQELEKRIALLEAKTAELQKWVTRRDEFVEKARQSLVLIYSRMRPDAAAMQLGAMDEETASAVLLKLEPRTASVILNEMEPVQAARLTAIISGSAKGAASKGPQAGPEEKKS